jgi:serine protease Do
MHRFLRLVFATGAVAPALLAASAQHTILIPDSAFVSSTAQSYLGIGMHDIDADRAAALKLKQPEGAEIVTIDHDAPAGKVGLRVHDVILQMNGQPVAGVEQLRRMLHETPAGRSITLVISRDGSQQTVSVQLANRATVEQDAWAFHSVVPNPGQDDLPPMNLTGPQGRGSGNGFFGAFSIGSPSVGAVLDTLGTQLADYFGVKDGQGLLVKHVAENSPAATAGLKAGDVVTRVNGQAMVTLGDWYKSLHANRGKQVQLTIMRNRREQTLSMQAVDGRHKGHLEFPSMFEYLDDAQQARLQSELAQLDTQIDLGRIDSAQIDSAQIDSAKLTDQVRQAMQSDDMQKALAQAQVTMNTAEMQKAFEQAQQAVKSIDMQKLQQDMKEQQQQIEKETQHLGDSLNRLQVLQPMD